MQTLVIYDTTGKIITQMQGSVSEPTGIPFLWVEIPAGKILKSMDVTVSPNKPVFEDLPKSDFEKLQDKFNALATDHANLASITVDLLLI